MPRNAQGFYTLPAGNPVIPGTTIESAWANGTMQDVADALTASLPRDGSAPMTGPLTLQSAAPTQPRHAASKAYVDAFAAYSSGMPIGSVCAFGGSVSPVGWILCNGQAVSRATYPDLFALIGTTYGPGDNSTTFNVPDLRDQFLRGRGNTRAVGSTQADDIRSHLHPVSDPTHTHAATQAAHNHATTPHTHGVTDPGHSHTYARVSGSGLVYNQSGGWNLDTGNTGVSQTGISIQNAGDIGMTSATPAITVPNAATGISVGATGGAETRPMNMAMDYYIKAVQDSAGPVNITSISTSDANMISVDNTLPNAPELVIHSNVAFGTVKLDASGKVPLAQLQSSSQPLLGYFDASPGLNPSEAYPTTDFNTGDTYIVSVGGSINCYDPVTLVSALRPVLVGELLQYIENSLTNPTGWYAVPQSSTIAASAVVFTPVGNISSTNVQDAIAEVSGDIPTTAAQIAYVPGGTIVQNTVQGAIDELDAETQTALGQKQDAATAVTKDSSTGAAQLPVGTQLQRPTVPAPGMLRFNDDTDGFEGFNGTNWGAVGGGATGAAGNPVFYENDIHVTANYSITSGKNAGSFGPIIVDNGVTVTIPPGSVWSVV